MLFRFPKDDKSFSWTTHVKNKMLFYRISEQKIKSILRSPDRKEEGIAPDTLAVMKRNDKPSKKEELWVMYAQKSKDESDIAKMSSRPTRRDPDIASDSDRLEKFKVRKMRIISAWRYPGVTKKGNEIPIPHDILEELLGII